MREDTDVRSYLLASKAATTLDDAQGPSSQYLRSLVPKTIPLMVLGTRVLEYWVLGPAG